LGPARQGGNETRHYRADPGLSTSGPPRFNGLNQSIFGGNLWLSGDPNHRWVHGLHFHCTFNTQISRWSGLSKSFLNGSGYSRESETPLRLSRGGGTPLIILDETPPCARDIALTERLARLLSRPIGVSVRGVWRQAESSGHRLIICWHHGCHPRVPPREALEYLRRDGSRDTAPHPRAGVLG
jgi:hypothetical protein